MFTFYSKIKDIRKIFEIRGDFSFSHESIKTIKRIINDLDVKNVLSGEICKSKKHLHVKVSLNYFLFPVLKYRPELSQIFLRPLKQLLLNESYSNCFQGRRWAPVFSHLV